MSSESAPAASGEPKGLPPVTPPSGRFLAQLFVVPGIIVLVAIGCIWFVTWLVGGFFSSEQFLKNLRSTNPEVRWRAASDLSQVLKRDPALAANPAFALELCDITRDALRDSPRSEREGAERMRNRRKTDEPAKVPREPDPGDVFTEEDDDAVELDKTLKDERNFIRFLISSIGNLSIPAGVPLLNEIAAKDDTSVPAAVNLRRRRLAAWALANFADPANLKRFDQLSLEQRTAVLTALDQEVQSARGERSEWARTARSFLVARAEHKPSALGVDRTLDVCSRAEDPALRKFAALALNFWQGTPAENARMEETLLALSRDEGRGAKSEEADVRGREIRYQAVLALARRGSPRIAPRLSVLQEMLDEESQARFFQTRLKDGRSVPDGALVHSVVTKALKRIAELYEQNAGLDLSSLVPAIEKLSHSDNPEVRIEADRTLLTLKRKEK